MKIQNDHIVDEILASLQGIKQVATDEYFYTRLKARMEKRGNNNEWIFPLKPVWLVGTLFVLLLLNGLMLSQQNNVYKVSPKGTTAIEDFATSYDQTITSSY